MYSSIGCMFSKILKTSYIALVSSKEFLDIQATIECRFTLRCVRYMKITPSNAPYR